MVVADAVAPRGERIKVLDFGIAKLTEASGFVQGDTTRSNLLMGTPRYMSPEQCRGAGKTDAKADVYSLGVLLFQFLAGRLPFVSTAPGELIVMHMTEPPPPLQSLAPEAPAAAATLVAQMLAKPAASRPTMAEIAQQLQAMLRLLDGRPGGSAEVAAVAPSGSLPGSPPTLLGPAAAPPSAASPAAPSLLPSSTTPLSVTSYEVEASSGPGASDPVVPAASSTLGQSLGQSLGPLPASRASRRRYLLVAPAVALLFITAVGARRLLAPAAVSAPAAATAPAGREPPAPAPAPLLPPSTDPPSSNGTAAAAAPLAAAGKDAARLGSRATSRAPAAPPPRAPLRRPPAKKSDRKSQGEKSLFDSID